MAAAPECAPEGKLAALEAWARAQEPPVDYGALRLRDYGGAYGLGAEATREVAGGEALVQVPLGACLNHRTALLCPEGRAAAACGAAGWDLVYIVLAAGRAGAPGVCTRWGGYLQALPGPGGGLDLVPVLWPAAVAALARGSNLHDQLGAVERALAELHRRVVPRLLREHAALFPAPQALALDRLRWAYAVFWSRALGLQLPLEPGGAAGAGAGAGTEQVGTLVPVADVLNHAPDAGTRYEVDPAGRWFRLVAGPGGVRAGQEACQDYGARADEKLLLNYGFMLAPGANPHNAGFLRLLEPRHSAPRALLAARGLSLDHYLPAPPHDPLSDALLAAATVCLLTEDEAALVAQGLVALDAPPLRLRALAGLHAMLLQRRAKFPQPVPAPSPALLAAHPAAVALAVRYRDEQLAILDAALAVARRALGSLAPALLPASLAAPAGPSPGPEDQQLCAALAARGAWLCPGVTEAAGGVGGVRVCAPQGLEPGAAWASVPVELLLPLSPDRCALLLGPAAAARLPPDPAPALLFGAVGLHLLQAPPAEEAHAGLVAALLRHGLRAPCVLELDEPALAGSSVLALRDAFLAEAAALAPALAAVAGRPVDVALAARLLRLYERGRGEAPDLGPHVLLLPPAALLPRRHPCAYTRRSYDPARRRLDLVSLVPFAPGAELLTNEGAAEARGEALLLLDQDMPWPAQGGADGAGLWATVPVELALEPHAGQPLPLLRAKRRLLKQRGLRLEQLLCAPAATLPPALLATLQLVLARSAAELDVPQESEAGLRVRARALRTLQELLAAMDAAFDPPAAPLPPPGPAREAATFTRGEQGVVRASLELARAALAALPPALREESDDGEEEQAGLREGQGEGSEDLGAKRARES